MSNIYHVTTQLGRMDSFFLEANSSQDIINLLEDISEADIVNIKKIIYSKNYKIATNDSPTLYPKNEDSIYKWSWICYSNNHTKQIDLYNLKPYTTKEDIEKFLKTQLIVDEPIIGFYDDVRTDFKSTSIFDENLYQVVYKYNSRTYTENFYSNNIEELKKFFDKFVAGELVEIREYEFSNLSIKEDDGNYYKRVSLRIIDNNLIFKTFIPNIKKNKDLNLIKQSIINNLRFNNKKIEADKIKFFLK
jgi:hypothetical protein